MRNTEFINAGAGSGKTTNLVGLLADYLKGDEQKKYKPGEVILTTFTELAAAEFLEKAREELLKKGMFAEASSLDSAAIGTVHSVAYAFVRKYWYVLGRGACENVISDNDKLFFINQSLAELASEKDIDFFEQLLKEFNFSKFEGSFNTEDPDFWKDHLKSIIEKMDQYSIDSLEKSIGKSKEMIDRIFINDILVDENRTKRVLEAYLTICGSKDRRGKVETILKSDRLYYFNILELSQIVPIPGELKQLPELDSVIAGAASALRSKHYGVMLKRYVDEIFGLAQKWKSEYIAFKAKNRLIDYNDMERLFLHLLDNPIVAKEIGGRYRIVFVDEFQDSNPIQLKIFDKLSELVEKSIWVGDPKQAIYGFRGSDALLIRAITQLFNKGDKEKNLIKGKSLQKSYRSRKGLVELSNDLFTMAFSDMKKEDIELKIERDDQIEFGGKASKELVHWHLVKNPDTDRATIQDRYKNLARQVAKLLQSEIPVYDKSLNKVRAVRPEDLAVLCRTNPQVNAIAGILNEYGIKNTGRNTDASYLDTAEVKLFLALLNYILNDRNDLAKAEILHLYETEDYSVPAVIKSRIRYVSERNDALKLFNDPENKEEISIPVWESGNAFLVKINEIARQIKSLPVPDLVESLIIRLDLKTWVSGWGDRERRINNLEFMQKQAYDYDQRCLQMGLGASLNNFIVYINALGDTETKAEKIKGAVNVLTYHKAKGLEWNVVILESLDYDELETNQMIRKSFFGIKDVLEELPSEDNLYPVRYIQLLPWFLGGKKNVSVDIRALIEESKEFKNIKTEIGEEIKRLLYVGVTRARDYLITVSYDKNTLDWLSNIGCKEITPGKNTGDIIDVFGMGHPSTFREMESDSEFEALGEEESMKTLVKTDKKEIFEPKYIVPAKVRKELKTEVRLLKDFNRRIAVSATKSGNGEIPSDAEIGTCLHQIFCVYDPNFDNNFNRAKAVLKNKFMLSVFPEPERIITSIENLYGFLKDNYGVPIKVYKEIPIQKHTVNGQIIRGSCDLVWETEIGYIIVDYKSFQGSIKQIITPEDKHYAGIYGPQLDAYKEVIETTGKKIIASLLYYAITGIITEVKTV